MGGINLASRKKKMSECFICMAVGLVHWVCSLRNTRSNVIGVIEGANAIFEIASVTVQRVPCHTVPMQ